MLSLRNTIAWKGANFLLNHVATPWYRDMVGAIVQAGVQRLLEEERQAIESEEYVDSKDEG